MNPVASWLIAFLVMAGTAAALVAGDRPHAPEPETARDPAKLAEVDAELILNRIREGDLTAIKGDLQSARYIWKAARAKGAGYWPIHEAIGDSMARHSLDADAEREYETASIIAQQQLRRVPSALLLKRAGLLIKLNQPQPALKLLIDCGEPDKLGGAILRLVKESPGLFDTLKQAAGTRDPRLWSIVAAVAPDAGDRASALGRYVRDVAPGAADLAKRAVYELTSQGKTDEALLVCADWAKASPSSPEVFETWGRLVAKSGNGDRARVILSTIVDVQPGHAPAHRRLGYALRDLGDYSGAIRQFEEVARLRSDEPEGLQEIVVTHLAQGDFAAAKARHAELIAKKWDPRFGDVGAAIRSKAGSVAVNAIDAARKSGDRTAMTNLRRWFAELGVPEAGLFDIKIIMKWDADSDVDLDVTEPGGETVNHNHARSQIGAVYPFDNTTGRGPEHYTLLKAPRGRYRVGVHLHGSTPSVAEVEVILFEETPRERRLKSQVRLDSTTSQAWPLEFDLP